MMRKIFVAILLFGVAGGSALMAQVPEPADWFAGDMHVHRSCGGSPVSMSAIHNDMSQQNLAALSLLADMGNGEVQNPVTDLPLVNGQDASVSTPGRIVHWDAEWHWDATYSQYGHQALGGHLVGLGLLEAHQIWQEYTYPIIVWAHQQNAIIGFAHMQYLDSGFPQSLNCCIPVEYPVEVALGSADFVSEDVNGSDTAIDAYYRLLNSGFRPGLAAGTDYPCNSGTVGSPMTYARVADSGMTYRSWIDGISNGRTVVSLSGHSEFLDLKVNGSTAPGDEVHLTVGGTVQVTAQWTATENLSGTIELVSNGVVVASKSASVSSGSPASLTATVNFPKSGWLAARRMGSNGHVLHTAAVFVTVNNLPVRANATDPQFYVQWMSNLLTNTSPGGNWNWYFPTSLSAAQARYQAAKALYQQIALEAQGTAPTLSSITVTPSNQTIPPGTTQQFTATGTYSNQSSLNITGQVAWSSSNPSVANINLRGLAVAANVGTAVISATQGSVSGSTSMTVGTPPLMITTTALGNAVQSQPYSATLSASGGTTPYTWSLVTGSTLPAGLSLSSAGVISGTPTTVGTFSFNVKVIDSGTNPQQAASLLSLTITTPPPVGCSSCSIWPATAVPALLDQGPDSSVELGVKFKSDAAGTITGIRFYKSAANTGTHTGSLWSSTGTLLATATFTNETASGWQQVNFSSPVSITAGTVYVASYHANSGHYSEDENYFATAGVDNPPLHALAAGVSGYNGAYAYSSSTAFPNQNWYSSNYWVDVVYAPSNSVTAIAVAPSSSLVPIGGTQSFTATATYSDSTTGDVTTLVTWTSSNTGVATIAASGVATGVMGGATTITATLGSLTSTAGLTVQAAPLAITTISLPSAAQSQLYSATLSASGGVLPYTWSLATGSTLPAGLSLSTAGVISGTPTVAGTTNFTVQVQDSGPGAPNVQQTATQTLSLTVTTGPAISAVTAASITASGAIITWSTDQASSSQVEYGLTTSYGSSSSLDSTLVTSHSISLSGLTAGTLYHYRVKSTNASGTQSVSGDYNFTTQQPPVGCSNCTIWPAAAVPAVVDGGPDNSVELGVKFKSDAAGTISAIRFYKSAANTGTHTGSLWSSTGTLLATATFSGETASGWQQVNFTSPVAVTANTVYVASYHLNSGHYAADQNYFSTKGVDNPPLHALADGVSGYNGAYAYGSSAVFPNQGWNSTNYWVDVVYAPSTSKPVTAIAVAPSSSLVPIGGTQPFTATATYNDSTTGDVTTQVTWASSNTGVATIAASGVATGVMGGATTITATLGSLTSTAGLTVQAAPLAITTISLPSDAQNQLYSATLSASGGVLPYTWSLAAGSTLPAGLSLSTAGVISGTPTVAGTTNFTVQVQDSGPGAPNVQQTATQPLSLTVTTGVVPVLSAFSFNPATVVGSKSSTGTVTLNGPAPAGGATITLSDDSSAVAVPASVTVAAGATSATFTATTSPVAASTAVTVTATYVSSSLTARLTVNPPALSSIARSPTAVVGGATSTATVTLSGPAPTDGIVVNIASSNTAVATVPSNTVTVPAGSTTAQFIVSTVPVSAQSTSSISALYNGVTKSVTLTVQVPSLASLTLSPSTVKGGTSSTGTVTLSGVTAVGRTITLSSTNTTRATVPASVIIPAGSQAATFTVTTFTRTSAVTVTIRSTSSGVTKSAVLTITP